VRRVLPPSPTRRADRRVSAGRRSEIKRFVRGDAATGILFTIPNFTLPIIVTLALGSEANSRFYIAFLFAVNLDLVGAVLSSALTTAAAHDESKLAALTRSALRRILLLVGAGVLILVVGAPLLLKLYGSNYGAAKTTVQLLALSCIPRAVVFVFNATCRVLHRTHYSAAVQAVNCVVVLGLTVALARRGGIVGIAEIILFSQLALALMITPSLLRTLEVWPARPLGRVTSNRRAQRTPGRHRNV
jgi:O-antigen/teichoic acid export membrane protein